MEKEVNLEKAWQKLDEAFTLQRDPRTDKKPPIQVGSKPSQLTPQQAIAIDKQEKRLKAQNPDRQAGDTMFEGGVETLTDIYPDELNNVKEELGVQLSPEQEREVAKVVFSQVDMEAPLDSTYPDDMIEAIKDAIMSIVGGAQPPLPSAPGSQVNVFETIERSLKLLKQIKK